MNPWTQTPTSPPFVLDSDKIAVDAFNRELKPYSDHWIHTGRLPEPRLGPIDAPVVLLQLNASYNRASMQTPLTANEITRGIESLSDEQSPHPCLANQNDWWDKAFGRLLKRFGRERLAARVCSIEYFAYPSSRFAHASIEIPSQRYQISLVERALSRGAIIVVTRGLEYWAAKVPGLAAEVGNSVHQTASRQRVWVTEGNLPSGVFESVCAAI